MNQPASNESHGIAPPGVRSPRDTQELQKAQMAVGKFARSLQVLLRAAKLYQKNHPHVMESLEAAERELRNALERVSPLEIRFERGRVLFRGQPLPDPREDLKKLSDSVLRRGISILVFLAHTHLGEIGTLAQLVGNAPLHPGDDEALDWAALVAEHRITGIRINTPLEERKADTVLTTLVAAVLAPDLPDYLRQVTEASAPAAAAAEVDTSRVANEAPRPATIEELAGVLRLLARIAEPLRQASDILPNQVVLALRDAVSAAERNVVMTLAGGMTRHAPRAGENLEPYFSRLGEALAAEFATERFRSGRTLLPGLRDLFLLLARELAVTGLRPPRRHGARWTDESYAETLHERFWTELSAEDKSRALTGREAWCVPVPTLSAYLEQLSTAGGDRQARFLLLNYARGIEADDSPVRLVSATGLSELGDLIALLWPPEAGAPRELARMVLRALPVEPAPEVASVLAGVLDRFGRQAVERRDFAEMEYILDTLEKSPRNGSHHLVNTVLQRMLENGRWTAMVEASLEHRPLDTSLPAILSRDPERLIDQLSARLTAPGGLDQLAPMARLLRAIGDAAIGALVTRLFDPRTPRATAAVKLLTVTVPEALVESLPRALPGWDWALQDMAAGELVRIGLPGTARAFLEVLPHAHDLVVPMMIDQIGMEGETEAIPLLIEMASGEPAGRDVFVRIKAVEALGRMRAMAAADLLRTILRQRNGLTYTEPAGLRSAAEEALAMIENRPSSGRVRTSYQAAEKASVSFTRPRRYLRVPLEAPLTARIVPSEQPVAAGAVLAPRASTARVKTISLGGAFVESKQRLDVGQSFGLEIRSGLRRIHGTAVVRNSGPDGGGVEFVHMKQEDREKLRQLVSKLLRK